MTAMSPTPRLTLTLQFPAAKAYPAHKAILPRATVARWIKASLFADAELTVRFVDEDEGRMLNRTYREKDYATNVLTFAYAESEDDPIAGDLILCCPVVEREAAEQGKPLDAHYAHLIVHGTLHAQGYDHETEEEAQEMESIETDIMQALGYSDPYVPLS
jgi:probable rRNA maturation factor